MRILAAGLIGLFMTACVFVCPGQLKAHAAGAIAPAGELVEDAGRSVSELIALLTGMTPTLDPDHLA
jgi:hypothetical protein